MKKLIPLMTIMISISQTCLAMSFNQPERIGNIGLPTQAPFHGFVVDGADENDGAPLDEKYATTYKSGVARFGDLFCRYKFDDTLEFGGLDQYVASTDGHEKYISKISSDEDLDLYLIYDSYKWSAYVILGRRSDGSWTRFIDTAEINSYYGFGENFWEHPHYLEAKTDGDTIVMPYDWLGSDIKGEFRFKWNDSAQWFSVDNIVF